MLVSYPSGATTTTSATTTSTTQALRYPTAVSVSLMFARRMFTMGEPGDAGTASAASAWKQSHGRNGQIDKGACSDAASRSECTITYHYGSVESQMGVESYQAKVIAEKQPDGNYIVTDSLGMVACANPGC